MATRLRNTRLRNTRLRNTRLRNRADRAGFSLVELLIVLAVLGVLITIGAMGSQRLVSRAQMSEATQTVAQTLRRIGDDAIRNSRQITLDESEFSNHVLVWTSGGQELGRQVLPHGASLVAKKQLTGEAIWFTGRGIPFQQVSFTIAKGNLSRTLTLLPSGLVVER